VSTPSVYVRTAVDLLLNGKRISFGSTVKPVAIAIAGEARETTLQIAASSVETLFDASSGPIGDFDFLLIASDRDVVLEFTTDQNDGVGDELYTMTLKGTGTEGEYGVPVMLGSDVSIANYTENFGGGTDDVIDRIRAKNEDASNTANVIIIVAT